MFHAREMLHRKALQQETCVSIELMWEYWLWSMWRYLSLYKGWQMPLLKHAFISRKRTTWMSGDNHMIPASLIHFSTSTSVSHCYEQVIHVKKMTSWDWTKLWQCMSNWMTPSYRLSFCWREVGWREVGKREWVRWLSHDFDIIVYQVSRICEVWQRLQQRQLYRLVGKRKMHKKINAQAMRDYIIKNGEGLKWPEDFEVIVSGREMKNGRVHCML